MGTRMKAAAVSSVCLAAGCSIADAEKVPRESVAPESVAIVQSSVGLAPTRFIEGGTVPYIFGFSPETGQIFGGAHKLLIPTRGARELMDNANLPVRLHPALTGSYLQLRPEVTQGVAPPVAFASNWWPQRQNGIADRWNSSVKSYADRTSDPDNLSPAEKYDLLFYPGQLQSLRAVRTWSTDDLRKPEYLRSPPNVQPAITVAGPVTWWELQNHGVYQRVYPEYWWGHCNGWSAYVTAEPNAAPRRDIRVKIANGRLAECAAGEAGCILFRMADIEALMSELYFNDAVTFAGRRCETRADQTPRDVYGRPVDPACRDLNPGSMHVVMTGLLGLGAQPLSSTSSERAHVPFVVDYTWDWEVWSFPVKQFVIDSMEEVSREQAAQLLCNGGYMGADCYNYRFNPSATRFVRVAARYWMISDQLSGNVLLRPADQRDVPLTVSEMHYVLELDNRLTILGGEWIKNPSIVNGVNGKEMHPDYIWMPIRPQGTGEDSDDLGGSDDNPYVSYSKVKALLALSRTQPAGQ